MELSDLFHRFPSQERPSLLRRTRQQNLSTTEAHALAAEIGEWNGDVEDPDELLETWRNRPKGEAGLYIAERPLPTNLELAT